MIFLVNDANILIDLLKLDLLDAFFRMEYDFQISDLVLNEVQEENVDDLDSYLETNVLTRQTFTFAELGDIGDLYDQYPALSIADCSCLYLIERLGARLLTGDGALRRTAELRGATVHGVLWVLQELVLRGHLTSREAHGKLSRLMELNQRLPMKECQRLLRKWQ
ncbi:hypothetical protein [Desulfobulbus alkaliphilus]|uniref:hypothetical protein n=1 Tax=Desulfobulbus alkaliphilus TaxID=869814 RepID=UPI0019660DC7|nr:hypothetical protein [Desulfobulbus alkaliphilus]MBM9536751.1 hypothetical protein [Desulfobulbus alkaliphilus]